MFFKLSKWQLGCQILFCLSDFHYSSNPNNFIGNEQRTAVVQAAKANGAYVVVEDVFRYMEHTKPCEQQYLAPHMGFLIIMPKDSPLYGLSSLCHHAGITTTNVEFRTGFLASYFEEYDTPLRHLERTETMLERIAQFDDGPIANAWYQELLQEYTHLINGEAQVFLQQVRTFGNKCEREKVIRYIEYYPGIQTALEWLDPKHDWSKRDEYDQKEALLRKLPAKLIDAELIHALMTQPNKKVIFLCAGDTHIANIEPVIKQLGGKKIAWEGEDLVIANNKLQEPNAIPIETLSRLLGAHNIQLPLLPSITLSLQSFLDKKITNRCFREAAISLSALAGTMSILSILPTTIINKTILRNLIFSLVISKGILWYASQPIKNPRYTEAYSH